MLVIVLLAFGRAGVADRAQSSSISAHDPSFEPRPAQANVAVASQMSAQSGTADALDACPWLRPSRRRRTKAHLRAIHRVVHGVAERLVDVPLASGCSAIILRMDMVFLLVTANLLDRVRSPCSDRRKALKFAILFRGVTVMDGPLL